MKKSAKTIESLGESGLIRRLAKKIRLDRTVASGIGDDCAAVRSCGGYTLLTCDMLVEGVDFAPREDPYLVGRKALAVSISDIASCGGLPRYALVSLGLPRSYPVRSVDRFYGGMRALAGRYGVNIVGGDMSRAPRLTIDVSLAGFVEKGRFIRRSGARPGDTVFVTGSFGGSIRGKHLSFTPRVEEARFLTARHRIHAMIDVSDGLCRDLYHILEASKVSALVRSDRIPLSRDASGLDDALYSGEDFELIFTAPVRSARAIEAERKYRYYPVGRILPGGRGLLLEDGSGKTRRLPPRGYSHF